MKKAKFKAGRADSTAFGTFTGAKAMLPQPPAVSPADLRTSLKLGH